MVTDRETTYVRFVPKNKVTGEEDLCFCKKATTPQDEAYIQTYAEPSNWDTFFHTFSNLMKVMALKKMDTERRYNVDLNPQ